MATVYDFPDLARIEEEAGAWLIRLDSDEPLSPRELEALREWLERSPVHREELSSLISFYGRMNVLTELAVPLGAAEPVSAGTRRPGKPMAWRLAAAAVLLVTLGALTVWINHDPLPTTNGLYTTTIGDQETTRLADGSMVQLNTNSRIEVDYDDQYRNVRLLHGEAYFTVAKRPDRPFRVFAGAGRIQALGTAFAVRLKDDDVDVTVAEGHVALAALEPPRIPADSPSTQRDDHARDERYSATIGMLSAGQSASIVERTGKDAGSPAPSPVVRTIDPQELARRLSWRKGLLVFAGEPLAQVVEEISRYTTTTIEVTDPALGTIAIGGQFRVGDTEGLLDALQSNFDLRVTRVGHHHVRLTSASHAND